MSESQILIRSMATRSFRWCEFLDFFLLKQSIGFLSCTTNQHTLQPPSPSSLHPYVICLAWSLTAANSKLHRNGLPNPYPLFNTRLICSLSGLTTSSLSWLLWIEIWMRWRLWRADRGMVAGRSSCSRYGWRRTYQRYWGGIRRGACGWRGCRRRS